MAGIGIRSHIESWEKVIRQEKSETAELNFHIITIKIYNNENVRQFQVRILKKNYLQFTSHFTANKLYLQDKCSVRNRINQF